MTHPSSYHQVALYHHSMLSSFPDNPARRMADYHRPDQKKVQNLRDIANKLRVHSINSTNASNSGWVCKWNCMSFLAKTNIYQNWWRWAEPVCSHLGYRHLCGTTTTTTNTKYNGIGTEISDIHCDLCHSFILSEACALIQFIYITCATCGHLLVPVFKFKVPVPGTCALHAYWSGT